MDDEEEAKELRKERRKKKKNRKKEPAHHEREASMLVQRVLAGVIEEEAEEDQYSLESAGSAPVLRSQRTSRSHSTTSSDGLSFLRALPAAAVAEKSRDQKSTTTASTPCASDMDPCTTDDDDRRTFGAEWTTVAGKGRRRPAEAVRHYEAAVSKQ